MKNQMRFVTRHFTGIGITGRVAEVWKILGVEPPPPLMLNSIEYSGEVPHDAVVYDREAAAIYASANRVRSEPTPEPWWTRNEMLQQLDWTEKQFEAARLAGFPSPHGQRTLHDADGIPTQTLPLWRPGSVRAWLANVTELAR